MSWEGADLCKLPPSILRHSEVAPPVAGVSILLASATANVTIAWLVVPVVELCFLASGAVTVFKPVAAMVACLGAVTGYV